MNEPPIIDHNPDETRPGNGIWWLVWGGVALLWIGYLTYREFDWDAIALGGVTGMVLATWAIEISDNKVPEWMIPPSRKKKRYLPDPIKGEPVFGTNAKRFFLVSLVVSCLIGSILWMTP